MNTSADINPVSRRARYRQATVEEIKALARQQLADQGSGALSLRAIAREMGVASSALYRYFDSVDELISALCVDSYRSVAEAVATAADAAPAHDHPARWWAVCQALRDWSLQHPGDFALIFGTPIPGHRAPEEVTGPAAAKFSAVILGVYADAVAAKAADPARSPLPVTLAAGDLLADLLERATAYAYPPQLAGLVVNAWASILGHVGLETSGTLPRLMPDTDALFAAHLHSIMIGMGFEVAAADRQVRRYRRNPRSTRRD